MAEANVAKVASGQPAEVTVEAIPDRRYKAVLRQVIPTADRTKATVMVKVTILDKDKDLKPEMSAKVTFLEPEKEKKPEAAAAQPVVLVPRAAVVTPRRQDHGLPGARRQGAGARRRARDRAAGAGDRRGRPRGRRDDRGEAAATR